jgi:hypothetical protein
MRGLGVGGASRSDPHQPARDTEVSRERTHFLRHERMEKVLTTVPDKRKVRIGLPFCCPDALSVFASVDLLLRSLLSRRAFRHFFVAGR